MCTTASMISTPLADVLEATPELMIKCCKVSTRQSIHGYPFSHHTTGLKSLRLTSKRMRTAMKSGVTGCDITITGLEDAPCVPMMLMLRGGRLTDLRVKITSGWCTFCLQLSHI